MKNRHQWRTSSLETFCARKPRLKSGRYQYRPVIETVARCLDGGWPGKDPSRTNVLRPLFACWGKDARSDIRRTPSPLYGMAGGTGLGLVIGNESRTLVRHVVQRSGYDGGNATTQRRISNANKLRHFGPVHVGTTRNGIEIITKDNWRRSIPESRSDGSGTGDAHTTSFGPNGGIGTMETFNGPIAVRDGTILKTARVEYAVKL